MSENLMNSDHKATNDKYRKGYDGIKWGRDDVGSLPFLTDELIEDYKFFVDISDFFDRELKRNTDS